MTAIFIAISISKQIAAQPCHERHGTWALGADAGAAVSSERVALVHRIRWEILQEFPLYLMVKHHVFPLGFPVKTKSIDLFHGLVFTGTQDKNAIFHGKKSHGFRLRRSLKRIH